MKPAIVFGWALLWAANLVLIGVGAEILLIPMLVVGSILAIWVRPTPLRVALFASGYATPFVYALIGWCPAAATSCSPLSPLLFELAMGLVAPLGWLAAYLIAGVVIRTASTAIRRGKESPRRRKVNSGVTEEE
jgi:hypothetical protein